MKVVFMVVQVVSRLLGMKLSSLLINDKYLVDTGLCSVLKMRQFGFDPLRLKSVILTHLHQDHYLGLPQVLFYLGFYKNKGQHSDTIPLRIVGPGPGKYLQDLVNAALEFLQISRFPDEIVSTELVPLSPRDHYEINELQLNSCIDLWKQLRVNPSSIQVIQLFIHQLQDLRIMSLFTHSRYYPYLTRRRSKNWKNG